MSRHRRRRLKRSKRITPAPKPVTTLVAIPPEHVIEVWPLVQEFIEAGCKDCESSAEDLRDEAQQGTTQLWLAWADCCEAAAITRLVFTPQGVICLLISCGGKGMDRWLGLLDEIELYAKAQGCVAMRIIGRLGWLRKLHDYDLTRIILDKRL
jgi:hypothetical protein